MRIGSAAVKVLAAIAMTVGMAWLVLDETVLSTLRQSWATADLWLLALALTLMPLVQLLRAWRFTLLLWDEPRWPPYSMFRITAFLLFFNYLLPFKTGELSFPLMARKAYGTSAVSAMGSLLLVRVLDLLLVAAAGAVAVHLLLGEQPWARLALPLMAAALAAALVLPTAVALLGRSARHVCTRLPTLSGFIERLEQGAGRARLPRRHAALLLSTALIWSVQYLGAWLCLRAIISASPWEAVLAASAAIVSFSLPINGVAAIGPLQAAWALALSAIGHDWGLAVATALIWHAVMLLGCVLLTAGVSLAPARPAS